MNEVFRIAAKLEYGVFIRLDIIWKFEYSYGMETIFYCKDAWYYMELLKNAGFIGANLLEEHEI